MSKKSPKIKNNRLFPEEFQKVYKSEYEEFIEELEAENERKQAKIYALVKIMNSKGLKNKLIVNLIASPLASEKRHNL